MGVIWLISKITKIRDQGMGKRFFGFWFWGFSGLSFKFEVSTLNNFLRISILKYKILS